jgi:hypothetical protein
VERESSRKRQPAEAAPPEPGIADPSDIRWRAPLIPLFLSLLAGIASLAIDNFSNMPLLAAGVALIGFILGCFAGAVCLVGPARGGRFALGVLFAVALAFLLSTLLSSEIRGFLLSRWRVPNEAIQKTP